MSFTFYKNAYPNATGTLDLGSASLIWNGIYTNKIPNLNTAGFVKTTGTGGTLLIDTSTYYKSGDTVTFANITDSALTSGRVVLAGTSGILQDDSGLTFNTSTNYLTATGPMQASRFYMNSTAYWFDDGTSFILRNDSAEIDHITINKSNTNITLNAASGSIFLTTDNTLQVNLVQFNDSANWPNSSQARFGTSDGGRGRIYHDGTNWLFNLVGTSGTTGEISFNDAGLDTNFRIEGDTDANLFFIDAGTDRVGIGSGTPATKLDVNGTIKGTGYQSSDGSAGATGTATAVNTLTIKNGLVTNIA